MLKKIVVKVNAHPDVKEVFVGEDLKVERTESKGAAIRDLLLIKDKDGKVLGEFDHFLYWRYVEPKVSEDHLRMLEAAMGKIQTILDDGQVGPEIRMEKIRKLMYEERQLELIHEPDQDLMLLNLEYLDSIVERLTPGMDALTLSWAIYAVRQFVENNLIPGGPCDPDDPEWSWDAFKDSFRPATFKDHVDAPVNPCKTCKVRPVDQHGLDEPCQAVNIDRFLCHALDEYLKETT